MTYSHLSVWQIRLIGPDSKSPLSPPLFCLSSLPLALSERVSLLPPDQSLSDPGRSSVPYQISTLQLTCDQLPIVEFIAFRSESPTA